MIIFVCTLALAGGLLVITGLRAPAAPRIRLSRHRGNPAVAVASGLAAGALALIATTLPAFAVIAALVGTALPGVVRRRRARTAAMHRAQCWPALLDDVTSAVRAGLDLPEAITQAGRRAPSDLRGSFAAFESAYRRSGDFATAASAMQDAAQDEIADQLLRSLTVARRVGGQDLTQVLRSLGMFVRADLQVRGELLARQSWTVNAARMAVAAPWVVLVLLASRPATVAAYRSSTGVLVLVAVAVLSALAYVAMLRIARLDVAEP